MKKLLLILVASVALAQTPPQAPVARVVPVKNGNAQEIYDSLSKLFPGTMTRVGQQIVVSALPSAADMLEQAIQKLDVPAADQRTEANVELTVYVLRATDSETNGRLPAELDATVRQLRTLFPYKNYGLMDTQVMRARSGHDAEASAKVADINLTYQVEPTVYPGRAPHTLRLARLQVSLRAPVTSPDGKTVQLERYGINTDLDAQEGQKTVVGKTSFGGDAVIVVVSPKVIE